MTEFLFFSLDSIFGIMLIPIKSILVCTFFFWVTVKHLQRGMEVI